MTTSYITESCVAGLVD